MTTRFQQAHREARWAVGLSLAYLISWVLTAYLPGTQPGITGLPLWFELSCLLSPLFFILLCKWMIQIIYRDITLEDDDAN